MPEGSGTFDREGFFLPARDACDAVLLPGSYDPVTRGHLAIIRACAALYRRVYVVLFVNPDKTYRFSEAERLSRLRRAVADLPGVTVDASEGLVIDYARAHGIGRIVKGIRDDRDLAYEETMAAWNLEKGGIPTLYYRADKAFASLSSTLVRERLSRGESVSDLIP